MHIYDDVEGVEDVYAIALSKKEKTIIQCKARRAIVSKACKMALERKVKGLKPLFFTCDSVGKSKPPHKKIWINMLHGYYGVNHEVNKMGKKNVKNQMHVTYRIPFQFNQVH